MLRFVAATSVASLMLMAATAQAATEHGTLECTIDPGIGLVIGSSKGLECTYTSADGKLVEQYEGRVTKLGVDIGVTGESIIVWQVVAPTSSLRPGALEGTYTGVGAEATVGAGPKVNALLGGSDKTVSLQPISVGAQAGLNVAAGISSIALRAAPR